jgi:hypothetical protein
MVDFHVDRNTGNDGASGSATQPVRTISRATELAAETLGATGSIYVAPGEYDLSIGELFPILVPPRFSLEGTSRTDRPVIRFEATTRDETRPAGAILGIRRDRCRRRHPALCNRGGPSHRRTVLHDDDCASSQ